MLHASLGVVALCLAASGSLRAEDGGDLPLSLNDWGAETETSRKQEDEKEWRETFTFVRKPPVPGDGKHTRPLFDWEHLEGGIWAGVVSFSSAFKAEKPEIIGSLSLRLPLSALPPLDRWGVFLQWSYSEIDRKLDFYYDHYYDQWWMLAGGADYLLLKSQLMVIRLQAGGTFVQFGDIDGLESGPGIFAGAYIGFHWVRGDYRFSFGYQPQFTFDGNDHMILNQIGFQFDF